MNDIKEDNKNIFNEVLAKSSEIEKLENTIDTLLDESEEYLDYMNVGKLTFNVRKISKLNTKILKFNFSRIHMLEVYSKPAEIRKSEELKEIYYETCKHFEIDERLAIIENKIEKLREISNNYITFSFFRKNIKRNVLELILLGMFPMVSIATELINWIF